jgi:hypothetical protein
MTTIADLLEHERQRAEDQLRQRARALPVLAEARALIERMEGRPIPPCAGAPDIVPEN